VRCSNLDEVLLAKSAFGFAARCQGFRYEGGDASLLASKDFQPLLKTSVG
jgi:hypothetical protein